MCLNEFLAKLDGVRPNGRGYMARCPAHEDRHASLKVDERDDGAILIHCHANCQPERVLAAIGLTFTDIAPQPSAISQTHRRANGRSQIGAVYPYTDESGRLLFEVVRYHPKDFRQRRPDGMGGYIYNLESVRRVLYRLPDVTHAIKEGRTVYLCEGEKDADNFAELGLTATTSPGGAGKWRPEYSDSLRGAHVVMLPDNDDAGRCHVEQAAESLQGIAASVRLLSLPGLPPKGDVSDWITAGGTAQELQQLAKASSVWQRPAVALERVPVTVGRGGPAQPAWPRMDAMAFYGLAGDVVRAIEPHTEADPVALLAQLICGFGNLIGRTAFFQVEADRHYGNLYVATAGETSKGRKGTSWGQVRSLLHTLDGGWVEGRIKSGLSSGEGLIWNVRDPIEAMKKGVLEVVDEGEPDKRLMVVETEFANVLRVLSREGNTLSAQIRDAWDRGDLSTLTKNNPARVQGAHVSIVGHITIDELKRHLSDTEAANGFANRFLWLCVRRSKLLPEGGDLSSVDFRPLLRRFTAAVDFARSVGRVQRDDDARSVWRAVYEDLSGGRPGLLGSVTSRAEAQVVRLSMLYALMDCSHWIRRHHLEAAIAVWEYAEQSAAYIFGDQLGDPVADEILRALRSTKDGLTRNDIREMFGRNKSAAEIGRALGVLEAARLAVMARIETAGRPAEVWRVTSVATRNTP